MSTTRERLRAAWNAGYAKAVRDNGGPGNPYAPEDPKVCRHRMSDGAARELGDIIAWGCIKCGEWIRG